MGRNSIVGVFIVMTVVQTIALHAQHIVQNQYKFKYLTVDQGLSNNQVRAICQDSRGFLWIATQNGLNKFDGQTIDTYTHNPQDSNTISSNFILSLFLDSKDNLWVGSTGGLDLYNSDYDHFERFSHANLDWQPEYVESVTEDRNGKLWIAALNGLLSYNTETGEIESFSTEEGNPHGLPSNRVYNLLVDKNDNLWISILNEGLYVYHPDRGFYKNFKSIVNDPNTLSGNRIERLYEDRMGNIWAGTYDNGLNKYNVEDESFTRINIDPDNIFSTRVRAFFEDLKGEFFVGTRGGLYLRNGDDDEFIHYAYDGHNFSDLSQNSIRCSFIDNAGTLWIGTFSGGVNYTNLNRKEFRHYISGKDDNHFLLGPNIYAITEDIKGNLWIGGDDGLNFLNRTTYTFKYFTHNPDDPNSLSYNDVKALEWDKNGNLWIATNKGGLNHYNLSTGNFTIYTHDTSNIHSISADKVYGLMNDQANNLWILTSLNNDPDYLNIDILPVGSDKFIHLGQKGFYGFTQDENGNVYIGGVNGFWIHHKQDSVFSFISNEELIGSVNCITIDTERNVWVGSEKGLVRYGTDDKSFAGFSEENGYPIGAVYGILEDNSKNLWISTISGLIKINSIVSDTANFTLKVFDSGDGLQSKQYNYNAYYKSKSGEMAFGGINGFNTFFPEDIKENKIPADVELTDLKIYNRSVPIGEEIDGRIVLPKSISVLDEITLGPDQNIFTLEFASLQNANSEKYIFRFRLIGLDDEWQYRKASNNFVTYTNLSAGDYTFQVTAANSDGFWNEQPVILKIHILPPFWNTWWFRIVFVLAVGFVILLFFYLRTRNLLRQNAQLEKKVNERTIQLNNLVKELQEKKDVIEKTNMELTEINNELDLRVQERTSKLVKANEELDRFVYSASHDLIAPLKSIIGLINIASLESRRNDLKDHLEHMEKSALKLENVIKSLTQYSRNTGHEIKKTQFLFDQLVGEVLDEILGHNHNKSINIIRDYEPHLMLNADILRVKIIMTNLVSNAIKYRNKEISQPTVKVGLHVGNGCYTITVRDNGIGIEREYLDRVFDMFYRATTESKGSGLGLYIVKETVEKLKGEIKVNSKIGEFTEVEVKLPSS